MRVLLTDDHRLLLEGLRNLLEAHGIEVIGVAEDGYECLRKARELRPDIILMDIGMPRCDGLAATRLVKSEMPEIKVVILSATAEDHDLFEAVKSGATGFLLKSMNADDLIDALDNALHDVPPLAAGLAARLLAEFARSAPLAGPQPSDEGAADALTPDDAGRPLVASPSRRESSSGVPGRPDSAAQLTAAHPVPDDPLSVRQEEVLALLAQGLSYKEVAALVSLTPRTVKYHMGEIMRKLHLRNRAQALAYAGSLGLGGDPDSPTPRVT
ncbi:MAG: response regulator transcription factor [Propionicimonas sp.]